MGAPISFAPISFILGMPLHRFVACAGSQGAQQEDCNKRGGDSYTVRVVAMVAGGGDSYNVRLVVMVGNWRQPP